MDFWTNLTALAARRGLTITELAERADLSRQALYKAKRRAEQVGAANIDASTARSLAHALKVSVSEIRCEAPVDTLSAAKEAARLLVELDGIDPFDAWMVMRDATASEGSVDDFYEAARIQLQRTAAHSVAVSPKLQSRARDTKLSKNGGQGRKVLRTRKNRNRK